VRSRSKPAGGMHLLLDLIVLIIPDGSVFIQTKVGTTSAGVAWQGMRLWARPNSQVDLSRNLPISSKSIYIPRAVPSAPASASASTAGPTLLPDEAEEATSTIAAAPHGQPARKAWGTPFLPISLPSHPRSLKVHTHHDPCYLCTNPPTQDERATPLTNSHTCHTGRHATGVPCQSIQIIPPTTILHTRPTAKTSTPPPLQHHICLAKSQSPARPIREAGSTTTPTDRLHQRLPPQTAT